MLRRPPVAQRPIITLPRIPALRELIIFVIPLDIRGAPSLFSGRSHCRVPRAAMMPSPSLLVPIFLCCCAWNKKKKKSNNRCSSAPHSNRERLDIKRGLYYLTEEEINTAHTSARGKHTHTRAEDRGTHGGPRIVLL